MTSDSGREDDPQAARVVEARLRASVRWLVAKAFAVESVEQLSDQLKPLFVSQQQKSGNGEESAEKKEKSGDPEPITETVALPHGLLECLTSGAFYAQAAARIFRDNTLLQGGLVSVLQRLQKMHQSNGGSDDGGGDAVEGRLQALTKSETEFDKSAHLELIDALMGEYVRRTVTVRGAVAAIAQKGGPPLEPNERPLDSVDSLLFWVNKVCALVRERDEDGGGGDNPELAALVPEMEDLYDDLSDGVCLAALVHFYDPGNLPLQAISFDDSSKEDDGGALRNIALVKEWCASNFALSPFHFAPGDLTPRVQDCYHPNVNALLADLFERFEGASVVEDVGPEDGEELENNENVLEIVKEKPKEATPKDPHHPTVVYRRQSSLQQQSGGGRAIPGLRGGGGDIDFSSSGPMSPRWTHQQQQQQTAAMKTPEPQKGSLMSVDSLGTNRSTIGGIGGGGAGPLGGTPIFPATGSASLADRRRSAHFLDPSAPITSFSSLFHNTTEENARNGNFTIFQQTESGGRVPRTHAEARLAMDDMRRKHAEMQQILSSQNEQRRSDTGKDAFFRMKVNRSTGSSGGGGNNAIDNTSGNEKSAVEDKSPSAQQQNNQSSTSSSNIDGDLQQSQQQREQSHVENDDAGSVRALETSFGQMRVMQQSLPAEATATTPRGAGGLLPVSHSYHDRLYQQTQQNGGNLAGLMMPPPPVPQQPPMAYAGAGTMPLMGGGGGYFHHHQQNPPLYPHHQQQYTPLPAVGNNNYPQQMPMPGGVGAYHPPQPQFVASPQQNPNNYSFLGPGQFDPQLTSSPLYPGGGGGAFPSSGFLHHQQHPGLVRGNSSFLGSPAGTFRWTGEHVMGSVSGYPGASRGAMMPPSGLGGMGAGGNPYEAPLSARFPTTFGGGAGAGAGGGPGIPLVGSLETGGGGFPQDVAGALPPRPPSASPLLNSSVAATNFHLHQPQPQNLMSTHFPAVSSSTGVGPGAGLDPQLRLDQVTNWALAQQQHQQQRLDGAADLMKSPSQTPTPHTTNTSSSKGGPGGGGSTDVTSSPLQNIQQQNAISAQSGGDQKQQTPQGIALTDPIAGFGGAEMTDEMQARRQALLTAQLRRKEQIAAKSEERESEQSARRQGELQRQEQMEQRRAESRVRREQLLEKYKRQKHNPGGGGGRGGGGLYGDGVGVDYRTSTTSLFAGSVKSPVYDGMGPGGTSSGMGSSGGGGGAGAGFGRPKSQSNLYNLMTRSTGCGGAPIAVNGGNGGGGGRSSSSTLRSRSNLQDQQQQAFRASQVQLPASIAEPTLKLFARQQPKSNRSLIANALQYSVFPGAVSAEARARAQVAMGASQAQHFLVLFRDGRCQYRGLYTWDQFSNAVHRIDGTGPRVCNEEMMTLLFKYDSGTKSFSTIPSRHLSVTIDGFAIADHFWQKGAAGAFVSSGGGGSSVGGGGGGYGTLGRKANTNNGGGGGGRQMPPATYR